MRRNFTLISVVGKSVALQATIVLLWVLPQAVLGQIALNATSATTVNYCPGTPTLLSVEVDAGNLGVSPYQYSVILVGPNTVLDVSSSDPSTNFSFDLESAPPGTFTAAGSPYTVRLEVIEDDGFGPNSDFIDFTVSVVSPTPAFVTTTTGQCAGTAFTFEASGGGTYSWTTATLSGTATATPTGGENAATEEYTFSGDGTVEITVTVTVSGCSASVSELVTVSPLPAPGFTASDLDVCANDIPTFEAPDGFPGATYVWSSLNASSGAVSASIPVGNSRSKNITFTNTGNTVETIDIEVVVTTAAGCVLTETATVTVNPLPDAATAVTPPSNEVCDGESFNFVAPDGYAGGSYDWNTVGTIPGNVTVVFPDTDSQTQLFTFTNSGAVTETVDLEVVVTTAAGCVQTFPITIDVNPTPPASFTAGTTTTQACDGDVRPFALTSVAGASYEWFAVNPSAGVSASFSSSTSRTPNVTFMRTLGTQGTGTIEIVGFVISADGCRSDSVKRTVQVTEFTGVAITGAASVCEGDAYIFSVDPIPGATYLWSIGTLGATISNSTSNAATFLMTNAGANGTSGNAGTVNCQITVNGCTDIITYNITGADPPSTWDDAADDIAPVTAGAGTPCPSVTYNYNTDRTGGVHTYVWSIPNAAHGTIIGSPNNNNVDVQWTAGQTSGTLRLDVTFGGCTETIEETYTITNLAPSLSLSTPVVANRGDNVAVTNITPTAGSTHEWRVRTLPAGSFTTGIAGQVTFSSTSTVNTTIQVGLSANGFYQIRYTETRNGCSEVDSFTVQISSCTNVGGTATLGDLVICDGESTFLQLTGSNGAIEWQISSDNVNFSPIGGGFQGSTIAPVQPALYGSSGTYYFRAKVTQPSVPEGICPAVFSDTVSLIVEDIPVIDPVAETSIDLCTGTTTRLAFTVTGGTSLQWQQSTISSAGPFSNITGETTNQYITPALVPAPGTVITRYYRLVVSGGCQPVTSQVIRVRWFPDAEATGPTTTLQRLCIGNAYQLDATIDTFTTRGEWTTPNGNNGNFFTTDPNYAGRPRQDPRAFYQATLGEAGQTVQLVWNVQSTEACGITSFPPANVFIQPDPVAGISLPIPATTNVCAPHAAPFISNTANGTGFFRFGASGDAPLGSTALLTTSLLPYVPTPGGKAVDTIVAFIDPANAGDNIVIEWVASDPTGTCTTVDVEQRTLSVLSAVLTGTFADPGPIACALEPLQLNGTTPAVGRWSTTGSGTFSTLLPATYPDPRDDPNARYTPSTADIANSPITITWEITSPSCGGDVNEISRQVTVPPLTEGQVDQAAIPNNICASGDTGPLNATVVYGNPGQWYSSSGNGTFTPSASAPNAVYAADLADAGTTINLQWVVTSPDGCLPDTTFVPITVDELSLGTPAFFPSTNELDNDSICIEEPTPPLGASVTFGSGVWTTTGNGGFTSTTDPNARYIPLASDAGTTITLTWTVTNGTCPPVAYPETIFVRNLSLGAFNATPSPVCELEQTNPLGATLTHGTGTWTAFIGNNPAFGTFVSTDPAYLANPENDPDARYQAGIGDGGNNVRLVWTVQNANCASVQYDQTLQVDQIPVGAITSIPDTACYNSVVTLFATEAVGQGVWSVSGATGGAFTSPNDPNSLYLLGSVDSNRTITFEWTVDNGTCTPITYTQDMYISRITANATPTSIELCEGTTTNITASAVGADTYEWTIDPPQPGRSVFSDPNAQSPIFNFDGTLPLFTGYRVIVTATDVSTGCFDRDTIDVDVITGDILAISSTSDDVCQGDTITLTEASGQPFAGLTWGVSPPGAAVILSPTSSTTLAIVSADATFSLEGINSNGCETTASRFVNVFEINNPIISIPDNCEGNGNFATVNLSTLPLRGYWFRGTAADAAANFRFAVNMPNGDSRWVDNNPVPATTGRDSLLTDSTIGPYTYSYVVVSTTNCVVFQEQSFSIVRQPASDFTASGTDLQFYSRRVDFTSLGSDSINTTNALIHFWDFGDPGSGAANNLSTLVNPTHEYSTFGSYPVTLYIENEIGCSDIEIKPNFITVAEPNYSFPTVFTPNGDDLNDVFRPLPNTLDNPDAVIAGILTPEANPVILDFRIFDRWGNLVFETNTTMSESIVPGWNGTIGNDAADAGTYTYRCVIDFGTEGIRTYDGVVRLLR